MVEYTPYARQLISHEEAVALEYEQTVLDIHQRREVRRELRKMMDDAFHSLQNQSPQVPMLLSQQEWDDIRLFDVGQKDGTSGTNRKMRRAKGGKRRRS